MDVAAYREGAATAGTWLTGDKLLTGSSGTRWVLTEPPPGCFCEFSLQLNLFFSTTFSVTAFFLVLKK